MPYGTINADLMTTSDGVSSAGLYGFKNRIINGQMQIAQRATSATITAGSTIAAGYSTVDRFYVYCTGANVTAAQVAGSGSIKNRLQITGAASVTAIGVGQRIEQLNSYDLANSTATLSVDLANSLLTTVTWTAYYANTADTFGTLASPTRTQISTGTFTVTSTVTNYNVQISIPAAATTGIEIVFTVGSQTSGTFTIGNVQLEKGSTATSFDYRPYGTELSLCQRYLPAFSYNMSGTASFESIGIGSFDSATALVAQVKFPVTTRVPATGITISAAADFFARYNNTNNAVSAITFTTSGVNASQISVTTSGGSLGGCGLFYTKNTAGSILFTGCEL